MYRDCKGFFEVKSKKKSYNTDLCKYLSWSDIDTGGGGGRAWERPGVPMDCFPAIQKVYFSPQKKNLFFSPAFGLVIKFGYLDIKKNFFPLPEVKLFPTYWIGNICDQKSKIKKLFSCAACCYIFPFYFKNNNCIKQTKSEMKKI